MAVVPNYTHIDFNSCIGDGCWHTPNGFRWVFDNTRTQELIPVSMIVGFFERHAVERHKAAVDIQRVWRGGLARVLHKRKDPKITFWTHDVIQKYTPDDPPTFQSRVERVQFKPTKGFDGPNPKTSAFASLVIGFFNNEWKTNEDLTEKYGEDFIYGNEDFINTFDKGVENLYNGHKWGLLPTDMAVDPERGGHIDKFEQCSQAFRLSLVQLKIKKLTTNYTCSRIHAPCEERCINVN